MSCGRNISVFANNVLSQKLLGFCVVHEAHIIITFYKPSSAEFQNTSGPEVSDKGL